MGKLDDAIRFATEAHKDKKRKMTGVPAILHSLEAAVIVANITLDEDVICAAVLHDVAEDTEYTLKDIEQRFGKRVATLVASETEDKRADLPPAETWKIRKEETLAHLRQTSDINVKILWLGDKLSNMRSFCDGYLKYGDEIWKHFNAKDKKEHQWYYEKIAEILKPEFKDLPAFIEYERLINIVFGKGEK